MFNMKMFVETDPDSRLAKRLYKETEELGRDLDQVD
jgi:uridine kinase